MVEDYGQPLLLAAVSTQSGDGFVIRKKWISLGNYTHNIHRGHSEKFPKFEHHDYVDVPKKLMDKPSKHTYM